MSANGHPPKDDDRQGLENLAAFLSPIGQA